jgi:hypothetical protein
MSFTTKKFSVLVIGFLAVSAVAAPLSATAASQTANTTINATVNPTITVSTIGTVSLTLTPGASPVESRASDTVTVNTNNTAGYTLTLADSDATTTLVSGANSISAHAGTFAVPTVLATNKWGYALAGGNFTASYTTISNETSSTDKWAGMPATGSPQTIKTTATTATNDTTTVWYGVKVDSTQPSGVSTPYSDQVTYTATTN